MLNKGVTLCTTPALEGPLVVRKHTQRADESKQVCGQENLQSAVKIKITLNERYETPHISTQSNRFECEHFPLEFSLDSNESV